MEHQTTGGYPKLANVCSVDFHRLGQLRPRDRVQFEFVSFEAARAAFLEQETLPGSCERTRRTAAVLLQQRDTKRRQRT